MQSGWPGSGANYVHGGSSPQEMLAGKLAERYREQKNIVLWHVSNEYEGACYCENCEKAFRVWLKKRYGTIENLNRLWNTRFWGHTFYDWDEIVAPSMVSEHFEEARSMYQAITLDYKRFNSDSMLANYRAEAEAIRAQILHHHQLHGRV